eukprot:4073626-Amphidinium_carterae.1
MVVLKLKMYWERESCFLNATGKDLLLDELLRYVGQLAKSTALYVIILRVSIDVIEVVGAWVLTAWFGPVVRCVVGVRDVVGCWIVVLCSVGGS